MMAPEPPERWQRIVSLFGQALDLPPKERGPLLDRTCGGDPALRAAIEDLLRADSEAGEFLGAPVDLSIHERPDVTHIRSDTRDR